ncbi:hypothetical protein KFK09_021243 [Dendrobium nobile]|uniref:DUF6821 domain-containing protein n=1 Tax=Dendrobium nobile TaxID=94219 RepID=A0A8T3AQL7_DENNO|nr:hypothetical protein KFK09_021243 [Dendrobium nobile]
MAGSSIPSNLHQFPNPPSPSPPFFSLPHTLSSTMEKTLQDPLETNFEEWEFLPDNSSFLEFGLDDIEDLISNEIIYTDYFREEPKLIQQTPAHNQEEDSQFKDISISHVFFKMINPKVDEEIRELKRPSYELEQSTVEVVVEEIEAAPSVYLMEEKVNLAEKGELTEEEGEEEKAMWEGIGIRIWRWRIMGVGALFSIGAAAAATICVVAFGGREGKQPPYRRHQHQSNLLQFHFHNEDQSVNQLVEQASRLNQALAAARGTPTMMRTAKISFGGSYDGL